MRGLIEAGLPPIVAFLSGTSIAVGGATPHPHSTDGKPADEATIAPVEDFGLQFVARSNAGI